MAAQLNSFSGKGSRRIRPDDIYPCIFDRPIEPMYVDAEQWHEIKRAWKIKTKYDA